MTALGEAFAVQVDPPAWARAAGAGSLQDLAGWLGVCCRDADEIADRIQQLDTELDDLPCQDLSDASVRAWVAVVSLRAMLDAARRQVLAAAEANDVSGLVASGGDR